MNGSTCCEAREAGSQQVQRPTIYKETATAKLSQPSPTQIHQPHHWRQSATRGTPLSTLMGISHERQE